MTDIQSKFHASVSELARIPAAVEVPPINRAAQLVKEQC
jgi:hypothetical protein